LPFRYLKASFCFFSPSKIVLEDRLRNARIAQVAVRHLWIRGPPVGAA